MIEIHKYCGSEAQISIDFDDSLIIKESGEAAISDVFKISKLFIFEAVAQSTESLLIEVGNKKIRIDPTGKAQYVYDDVCIDENNPKKRENKDGSNLE